MFDFLDHSVTIASVLGFASGILSTFAYLPYAIDTLARRTQPQRASWLIWSVLGSIAFFSQVYEGASSSLWFAGVQVSGTVCIFVLSIRFGVGGFLNSRDLLILLCALAGLVLWYFTETAMYALGITISTSLLGGSVTVLKAYREPESETLSTWAMLFVAATFAILCIRTPDWMIVAYPLYLYALNGAIVTAIALGRFRDMHPAFSSNELS